jgi:glycosyltransferase involved in cell wall biosynthesis
MYGISRLRPSRDPDRPRIVSLTPTALSRDSRTLKSAASYARFGFDSVVIEGIASAQSFDDLHIRVRSIASRRPGSLLPAGRSLMRRPRAGIATAAVFVAFLCFYAFTYCVQPLRVMRRGALYHLHSYEYFPLVRLWCALFGGCYIYDAHDFYSGIQNDDEMSSVQRRWIRPFQLWLEKKCVAGAAAFITVNEGTADLMEMRFGRRPMVLRNCHDFRLDRPLGRGLREAAGLAADDFLVVSIGQWKPGQATAEAIEALTLLDARVHLAFVGSGYDWVRSLLERFALSDRVHLMGAVPADEIVPFVASADAGLVHYREHNPNYANALPNGFFQALAAGLPLVYVDLPGITAVARAYDVGIVAAGSSATVLAAALRRLVEDEVERRVQREAVRRFSAAVNFEKEEKILSAVVSELVAVRAGEHSCAA